MIHPEYKVHSVESLNESSYIIRGNSFIRLPVNFADNSLNWMHTKSKLFAL